MASVVQKNFRIRNSYGQIEGVLDIPNLIDIQKQSYTKFLQMNVPAEEREDTGLQGVFKSVFPIKDFNKILNKRMQKAEKIALKNVGR